MNFNDGNVFFLNDFDDSMEGNIVIPLTRQIQHQAEKRWNRRIDLYINSFGGYRHLVFQLISLVNAAKREDIVVRTIVPDVAYSAGSILAVSGTPGERYIERNAEHLIHYGHTMSMESTPEQVERTAMQKREGFKKIRKHYAEHTRIPEDQLDILMNDDNAFIPAAKCIKLGLADKYMDKFDIGFVTD